MDAEKGLVALLNYRVSFLSPSPIELMFILHQEDGITREPFLPNLRSSISFPL